MCALRPEEGVQVPRNWSCRQLRMWVLGSESQSSVVLGNESSSLQEQLPLLTMEPSLNPSSEILDMNGFTMVFVGGVVISSVSLTYLGL